MKFSLGKKAENGATDRFETRPDIDWSLPAYDPAARMLALSPGSVDADSVLQARVEGLEDRLHLAVAAQGRLATRSEEVATRLAEQRQSHNEEHHKLGRRIDELTAHIGGLQLRPDLDPIIARLDELAARVDRLSTPHEHTSLSNRLDGFAQRIDKLSDPHLHTDLSDGLEALGDRQADAETRMEALLDTIENRLSILEKRHDAVATGVDPLERRLSAIESRIEVLAVKAEGSTKAPATKRPARAKAAAPVATPAPRRRSSAKNVEEDSVESEPSGSRTRSKA